jgi:hypothetical protein
LTLPAGEIESKKFEIQSNELDPPPVDGVPISCGFTVFPLLLALELDCPVLAGWAKDEAPVE